MGKFKELAIKEHNDKLDKYYKLLYISLSITGFSLGFFIFCYKNNYWDYLLGSINFLISFYYLSKVYK